MVPCFGDGCSGFDRTGAHDSSSPTQAAQTDSVIPGEVLSVPPRKPSPVPVPLNEALPVTPNESLPTRICQTDGPATTPERSAFPKTSHEKTQLTSKTPKSTPTRSRRQITPAHRPNHRGSLKRNTRVAHGATRRIVLSHQDVSKEIRVPVNPVTSKPSPCDSASNSQQPVASNLHGTSSHSGPQPTSEVNNQTTPPTFFGAGLVPLPSESSTRVQEPGVSPSQINCGCLQSALRMLEELETRNHRMQDYSAWALSQHLASSLGKCVGILECKGCVELSEQMMLMIIIAQKITKMFSGLATRFAEQDQSIFSSQSSIPLPRLVLIQQLRLERVLNHLGCISRSHIWETHLAMIDSVSQYSKDIMDRLRRLNGHHNTLYPIVNNRNNPIILDEE